MVTRNDKTGNPKTGKAPAPGTPRERIKGLTSAARQLGVTYTHLSLVLHGHRKSASLTRRYQELRKQTLSA